MSDQDVETALNAVYDAALESDWLPALRQVANCLDAQDCVLNIWDAKGDTPVDVRALGTFFTSESMDNYAKHYGEFDHMRMHATHKSRPGEVLLCTDVVDEEHVRSNALFQDLLLPLGGRYIAGSKLIHDEGLSISLGFHRRPDSGAFDESGRALLQHFVPHLQRAFRIGRILRPVRMAAGMMERVMDSVSAGLLLLDRFGKLIFANRAAWAALEARDGLGVRHGAPVCDDPLAQKQLQELIAHQSSRLGRGGAGRTALTVPRASGMRPWLLLGAALRSDDRLSLGGRDCILLMIVDNEAKADVPGRILADLFGITGAETRIAVDLLAGLSPDEIAERRNVAISTVRSQISSILSKTETRRQTDLIALLGKLANYRG